jgi:hypothetical protein
MKRTSFFELLTLAVTTIGISSCNKDELTPSVYDNFSDIASESYTTDLVADHWTKIVQGVYTCTFTNIIPSAYRNNRGVKVYLVKGGQKIQIDYPIHFMDGELSATTSTPDVTINYRCYAELPFDLLRIAVEIS